MGKGGREGLSKEGGAGGKEDETFRRERGGGIELRDSEEKFLYSALSQFGEKGSSLISNAKRERERKRKKG